jgi:three-Cys-motif partner protein
MEDEYPPLFDLTDFPETEKDGTFKFIEAKLWTENKALLIARYLRYFVFITKHGTYLDAFAGPQQPDHPHSWAAKLVLESEPKWFRKFVFFELNKTKGTYLESLISTQPVVKPKRTVVFYPGDMNENIPRYLADHPIKPSEATFCLLDQHTFECDWATVETLARHKGDGNKIELFYFLAQGWIDRAVSGLKDPDEKLRRWWGNDDWNVLLKTHGCERGRLLANRFKNEFGYRYAYGFPIYERDDKGGKIMFWMVHASDHPEAPKLMMRAYCNAIAPLEPVEQLELELSKPGV